MLSYGIGSRPEGRNPTEKEILSAGEGDCGMYAYLFCKELSRRGAKGTAYDLRTFSYEGFAISHTAVEVETEEGKMVCDSTHGVYCCSDL